MYLDTIPSDPAAARLFRSQVLLYLAQRLPGHVPSFDDEGALRYAWVRAHLTAEETAERIAASVQRAA